MQILASLILLLPPIVGAQCVPATTPLANNNIAIPFAVEVSNTSYPAIHGRRLNFWKAGGGDNHLYLSPAGDTVSNNTLIQGVLTNREWWWNNVAIRAVINGEVPMLAYVRPL
jgi:peptidoglycan hydrolase-like protein with peptidoglycan-binding domain